MIQSKVSFLYPFKVLCFSKMSPFVPFVAATNKHPPYNMYNMYNIEIFVILRAAKTSASRPCTVGTIHYRSGWLRKNGFKKNHVTKIWNEIAQVFIEKQFLRDSEALCLYYKERYASIHRESMPLDALVRSTALRHGSFHLISVRSVFEFCSDGPELSSWCMWFSPSTKLEMWKCLEDCTLSGVALETHILTLMRFET